MTCDILGNTEFWSYITIFVLACFIGYYVVWSVTPALHSPLMAVTNAISSVVILGGMLAVSSEKVGVLGLVIIFFSTLNIVGGFYITHRMLLMFSKPKRN